MIQEKYKNYWGHEGDEIQCTVKGLGLNENMAGGPVMWRYRRWYVGTFADGSM